MILALFLVLADGYILDDQLCPPSGVASTCPHTSSAASTTAVLTVQKSLHNSDSIVVVAMASQGTGTTSISVADDAGTYTQAWTRIKQCVNGTTAVAEVWEARATAIHNLTATSAGTPKSLNIILFGFSQADKRFSTNFNCATGSGTAQSVSLTVSSQSSFIVGAGADSGTTTARTMTAGTKVEEKPGATGNVWGTYLTAAASNTSATFSDSAPTTSTVWAYVISDVTYSGASTVQLALAPQLRQASCAVNGDCASIGAGSLCDLSASLCTMPTDYHGFHPGSFGTSAAAVSLTNLAKLPWGKCSALNVTPGGQGACYGAAGHFGKAIR